MAERTAAFNGSLESESVQGISDATSRVKASVEQFVEDFDLQGIAKRIESFGRENPVGLALTALTLGLAVGVLIKSPKRLSF